MRVNEHYFNRLCNFLRNTEHVFNYSENSEFIRGQGTKIISTVKLKHEDHNWIISSRDEGLVSVVIFADKTYYATIDLAKESIEGKGKVFSNQTSLGPDDFPEGVWDFAERLIHLQNNAVSFILSL